MDIETVKTLVSDGKTDTEIAERFGISASKVWSFRNRFGIRSARAPGQTAAVQGSLFWSDICRLPDLDQAEAAWARGFKRMGRNYAGPLP